MVGPASAGPTTGIGQRVGLHPGRACGRLCSPRIVRPRPGRRAASISFLIWSVAHDQCGATRPPRVKASERPGVKSWESSTPVDRAE